VQFADQRVFGASALWIQTLGFRLDGPPNIPALGDFTQDRGWRSRASVFRYNETSDHTQADGECSCPFSRRNGSVATSCRPSSTSFQTRCFSTIETSALQVLNHAAERLMKIMVDTNTPASTRVRAADNTLDLEEEIESQRARKYLSAYHANY
jgi:hypothetical protein